MLYSDSRNSCSTELRIQRSIRPDDQSSAAPTVPQARLGSFWNGLLGPATNVRPPKTHPTDRSASCMVSFTPLYASAHGSEPPTAPSPQESSMNEKTKQRLESEINVPAPTQPVDKLRIAESPAEASHGVRTDSFVNRDHCYEYRISCCFADDE